MNLYSGRGHDLPEFVYFNHSIHIAKGVGCATCHGRVDKMPLMFKANTLNMNWRAWSATGSRRNF